MICGILTTAKTKHKHIVNNLTKKKKAFMPKPNNTTHKLKWNSQQNKIKFINENKIKSTKPKAMMKQRGSYSEQTKARKP
jgi:hypothetical protein